jgi:hypothetical protein
MGSRELHLRLQCVVCSGILLNLHLNADVHDPKNHIHVPACRGPLWSAWLLRPFSVKVLSHSFNYATSSCVEMKSWIKQSFLVDIFISQFSRLVTAFKCYKVYWPIDQEGVCHEMKSLTIVVSHSFQDIGNEMDRFHSHGTSFIFLYKYNVMSSSNLM